MIINTEWLKEKNASNDLITWFADRFPNGGDLQSVLDQACADIRPGEASWILKHAGRNDSVYAAETLKAKHFVFAGSIKISGPIEIDGFIEAGWGIEAGCGIKAGWGIKAGCDIEAGWGIKAGDGIEAGWGIEAGCGMWAVPRLQAAIVNGVRERNT